MSDENIFCLLRNYKFCFNFKHVYLVIKLLMDIVTIHED